MQETGLIKYDEMCRLVADCYEIDEVKEIRDKALAMQVYAQQAMNHEAEIQCIKLRIRSERRCGQMLKERELAVGSPGNQHTGKLDPSSDPRGPKFLEDLKISHDQSSQWQKLADIPDEEFEERMDDRGIRPSTSGLLQQGFRQPDITKLDGTTNAMDEDVLWLWYMLIEFESREIEERDPVELVEEPTPLMQIDIKMLIPKFVRWLNAYETSIDEWKKAREKKSE